MSSRNELNFSSPALHLLRLILKNFPNNNFWVRPSVWKTQIFEHDEAIQLINFFHEAFVFTRFPLTSTSSFFVFFLLFLKKNLVVFCCCFFFVSRIDLIQLLGKKQKKMEHRLCWDLNGRKRLRMCVCNFEIFFATCCVKFF